MFSTLVGVTTGLAIAFYSGAVLAQMPTPEPVPFSVPYPESQPQTVGSQPQTAYVLGAGDQIRLDIFDVPEFSGSNGVYSVLVDGSLNLPWIGKVYVQGLTLEDAAQALTDQYAPYINDPLVTVTLLTPRPLRIGVVGEVNRPGVYTTNVTANGAVIQWQTVTQAIQLAGGITQLADLRNIQIRRPLLDGTEEILNVNLWQFLQSGDLSQDRVLRDGDTLMIPTASDLDATEMSEVANANFSPASIRVNVVGEVVSPGVVDVPPNSTLNQALLASGGFDNRRARRGEVTLIRLNPNGTVSKRSVDVDFAAGLNEDTNPALRNNDVIVVGRSMLASASDVLATILSPLNGLFGIFRLFGGL
jgi:polysaccharide biosynthesis/export protein